jgi:hypothetical protein
MARVVRSSEESIVKSAVRRRWSRAITVVIGLLAIGVGIGHAQQIFRGYYGSTPPKFATATTFKGAFNFCRAMFSSNRREKRGWDTDYPGADINFSIRLSELTKTRVSKEPEGGDPDHVVVRLTDNALFQCPFLLMEDAGTAIFNEQEVVRLREYLLKGGFLFVSDYWGPLAKEQFDGEIGRALPRSQYPIVTIPMGHPIWHTQFEVTRVPQMPSIQSWRRSGGTFERGVGSGTQDARGIADDHGRLMVVMLHNTDVPDGWEREGEDREYFLKFSPDAYSVGIDIAIYGMTH